MRTSLKNHFYDIETHEAYVTAEKVRNSFLGITIRQQTLLGMFSKHNGDVRKLVGIICDCVWANMNVKTTAVIFTPDHGGKGTGHGGKTMSEMQVPDIVIGAKIPSGHKINRIVMKYDNAPTIAYLSARRDGGLVREIYFCGNLPATFRTATRSTLTIKRAPLLFLIAYLAPTPSSTHPPGWLSPPASSELSP